MPGHLHISDPEHSALHAAVRTAIVVPGAFAIGEVAIRNEDMALFSAFGAFALLLFCEFTGPRRGQLIAYVVLALVGAALIIIGTLLSQSPALVAAAAMGIVAFVVIFAGIVDRYFAAAANAA